MSGSAPGWGEPARGNVPAGGKPVTFQSRENVEESVYQSIFWRIFKPVCGMDGKTYINDHDLKCQKVDKNCDGDCPCKIDCMIPK